MLRKIYNQLGVFWTVVILTSLSIFFSVLGTGLIFLVLGIYEGWGLGLTIAVVLPLVIAPSMSSIPLRLLSQLDRAEQEKAQLVEELQESIINVKTLKGLIPICASCKKIRDDEGYWQQLEVYIRDHSEARLSHGYCPECTQELYAEVDELRKAFPKSTS